LLPLFPLKRGALFVSGIYLGVPLVAGALARAVGLRLWGRVDYDARIMPRLAPLTLVALLFTIVVMFCLKGAEIVSVPLDVGRVALPLLIYFALTFAMALGLSARAALPYELAVTVAFTAASNNFELAIAVAVGAFGLGSPEAFAAVVGPLVEVPVMMALVQVTRYIEPRWSNGWQKSAAIPSSSGDVRLI
jgi:ACR3 family arsenite transporter